MIDSILRKGYDTFRDTPAEQLLRYETISDTVESMMSFQTRTFSYEDTTFDVYMPSGYFSGGAGSYFPPDCHEPAATAEFINHVDEGDVVWDMGSMIGYFTALGAHLNEFPEDVHVFETSTLKCWILEQMSDELFEGKLNVIEAWISDTDTTGLKSDMYAEQNGPPDFVKLDIEGAEVPAVKGMEETIESEQPTLLIEVHPNKIVHSYGSTDEKLLKWLSEYYDLTACVDYENSDFTWTDDWENVTKGAHDIGMNSPGGMKYREQSSPLGWVDCDSYQVLCRPE